MHSNSIGEMKALENIKIFEVFRNNKIIYSNIFIEGAVLRSHTFDTADCRNNCRNKITDYQ